MAGPALVSSILKLKLYHRAAPIKAKIQNIKNIINIINFCKGLKKHLIFSILKNNLVLTILIKKLLIIKIL